ncbi:zinc finger protein ZPR1-like [Clavelina lepadiformis]|uniref:zinc finger protein ZPR1-like n=1 Tax=Clavelina lepadiformis TaxID=159417 RepID=UPI0040414F6D
MATNGYHDLTMTSTPASQSESFPSISADNEESDVTEIESLCVNCEKQGTTKFLFIKIPFYREVILSSFSCPHCFNSNNEIQSAGQIQVKGIRITLTVKKTEDLDRQVVRSDVANVCIPELKFEIPASSQKGTLTTVEGIIQRAVDGLEHQQPLRRAMDPDMAEKLDKFIESLKKLLQLEESFTLTIDDPTGNSFVENPKAPCSDPNLKVMYYVRTLEQDQELGIKADTIEDPETEINGATPIADETDNNELDLTNEVVSFPTNCPECHEPCTTNMKLVKIPHFKEVIIMATNCDKCGHRSNEVKSGSGFEPKGKIIKLHVTDPIDMSRDVLKSETCTILIPELDVETGGMAISGKFTTVEGLLGDLKDMMVGSNPFVGGDSDQSKKLIEFGKRLDEYATGNTPFTLILDDPNSNSFIQNICTPDPDPSLTEEEYVRSYEQNEMLGLNDMKTEDYC